MYTNIAVRGSVQASTPHKATLGLNIKYGDAINEIDSVATEEICKLMTPNKRDSLTQRDETMESQFYIDQDPIAYTNPIKGAESRFGDIQERNEVFESDAGDEF